MLPTNEPCPVILPTTSRIPTKSTGYCSQGKDAAEEGFMEPTS